MQSQSSSSIQDNAGRAFGMAIGNLFLGGFGMAWIVLGLLSVGKANPTALTLLICYLALLVGFSIYIMQRTHGSLDRSDAHRETRKKINRRFGRINGMQWGAILAVCFTLYYVGLAIWILPAIILIVGIHFFPLARLFNEPRQYITGSVMVAWAILYPILFSAGKGDWIGAVGTGAILWVSGAFACWKALRLLRKMRDMDPGRDTLPNGDSLLSSK